MQAGLAIFDTMQYIPCDINTVCFGMAASMGAFLLSAGTKVSCVVFLVCNGVCNCVSYGNPVVL